MLGLGGVPSALQFLGMLCLPESPRWLGKMGKTEEQRSVMQQIYKPEHVARAKVQLQEEIEKLRVETRMSQMERLKSLFTTYGKCLFIGCTLQGLQQFIGINTAMYYGPDIM